MPNSLFMTLAPGPEPPAQELRGELRFVEADARVRLRSAVEAAGWLLVVTQAFGPAATGLLDKIVEEEIEQALIRRGAPSPGLSTSSPFEALLDDQLYRARASGIRGITLSLGSLAGLVTSSGTIDPVDSATLRFLASACRNRAFALWLAQSDQSLLAYAPPLPLADMLAASVPIRTSAQEPSTAANTTEVRPTPSAVARPSEQESVPWRTLMHDLDEAQGPKPLAAVERLFVERYLPLAQALARGEAEPRARQTLMRFANSFEKSYREAFAAAKVTRRRPSMVLDAPQIAARAARLHGARYVSLLLVDALRYDVGLRLQELLREELAPEAVCTESVLLWAALPTVTSVQLDLLARGPAGLVESLQSEGEHELVAPRGKAASTIRRLRAGGRELHKLDVVQSLLTEAGPREPERIEALAREATAPIVKFARGLQPRTLLFLFGDHGFELPAAEQGTGPAKQGGASPEQVLVPGQAWLLGAIH